MCHTHDEAEWPHVDAKTDQDSLRYFLDDDDIQEALGPEYPEVRKNLLGERDAGAMPLHPEKWSFARPNACIQAALRPIGTDLSPTAEVGTNEHGGKSTVLAARFDLMDPQAVQSLAYQSAQYGSGSVHTVAAEIAYAIEATYKFFRFRKPEDLEYVQFCLHNAVAIDKGWAYQKPKEALARAFHTLAGAAMFVLAEVLGYGAKKYARDNWRAVGVDEHLNHMLTHLWARLMGDTQDDHLGHAFCRAHMALAVHYQGEPWVVVDGTPQPRPKEAA